MTPSQMCKSAGLDSFAELVKAQEKGENTLLRWHKEQPELFELLVLGLVAKKKGNEYDRC